MNTDEIQLTKSDPPRFSVTVTLQPAVEIDKNLTRKALAIFMVKLIRTVTGLGLADSKDLYDDARGFSKKDFPEDVFQRKMEELIYKPFRFTVPALYTRRQLYNMVNKHSGIAKFNYVLVKNPSPELLAQTERFKILI